MNYSRYIMSSLAIALGLTASAVPAKRGLQTVTQPDGTEIQVRRVGDERSHFMLTSDNKLITAQADGTYCYAKLAVDGRLVSTGIKAVNPEVRSDADNAVAMTLDGTTNKMLRSRAAKSTAKARRSITQSGMGRFTSNFPKKGAIKGLVILVQYQDVKFKLSNPKQYFTDMLNKQGFSEYGGTGSARDFFIDNSNGAFTPQFDVFGPFTLPNNMAYYGANDYISDQDQAAEDMIVHGCKGLDAEINFADYDFDNDGYVDNVFVFYAGQGEASYGSEDTVWPHQWELSEANKVFTLDGKKINRYACSNEWEKDRPDGIGTFVHEFSHVMGLPDLYVTDDSDPDYTSPTPGEWSVMDYGPYNNDGRTPPCYSMFERNAMEWTMPEVITDASSLTLTNLATSNKGYLIPTNKDNEFFLLENRQKSGWDKYLPGHGMLIWHVDFNQTVWDSNAVNNTLSHHYVQIEPSNGSFTPEKNSGWAWPNSASRNIFTASTTPTMKTWAGKAVNFPLTNITETADGVITFDVLGGKPAIDKPAKVELVSANSTGFTIQWDAVADATDYLVSVTVPATGGQSVTENYDSHTLPTGWTSSTGGYYTSGGNYKTGSQSVKLSATGHHVTTGKYENDVDMVKFWYKSQNASGKSALTVNGLINDSWTTLNTTTLTASSNDYLTLTDLAKSNPGIKQVRITYTKDKGNVSVDDITITTSGGSEVSVPNYTDRSSAGQISMNVDLSNALGKVEGIPANQALFKVSVKATNGKDVSQATFADIDLTGTNGIADIDADGTAMAEYYNLQGIRVVNPSQGLYIVKRGNRTTKVYVK